MKNLYAGLLSAAILISPQAVEADEARYCSYANHENGTNVSIQEGMVSFGELLIDNRLAGNDRRLCVLTLFGVDVRVVYDPDTGVGDAPDWFHISVPPGFRVDQPSILVYDGTSVLVPIWIVEGPSS